LALLAVKDSEFEVSMKVTQQPFGSRFGLDEIEAVIRVMKSGRVSGLTSEGEVDGFAREFADHCGVRFALPLNGASNALSIATHLINLRQGDEVITNPITYIATAIYPLKAGATIRFAETCPDTLNVDIDTIEPLINERTKALYLSSYDGYVPNMERLRRIADEHSLFFIFDAARCAGGRYNGKHIATYADATAFSFQEQKNMATCDGGALVMRDQVPVEWTKKATQLRNVRGTGEIIGENFRMDELRAAIGRTQLPKLERMNDERREIARRYTEGLAGLAAIKPVQAPSPHDHVYHWYVARLETSELNQEAAIFQSPLTGTDRKPTPREAFASLMGERGIDMPVHNQPAYMYEPFTLRGYGPGLCPTSERLWRNEIFRLPINLDMTASEIDLVIDAAHHAIAQLS
jgi:perosamine synthetase